MTIVKSASVLVPWAENRDHAPTGLAVEVYDGTEAPAELADLSEVELYVMPYGRPGVKQLIKDLPKLKALQVLTAGYDAVLDVLPEDVELYNGTGLHDASTAELALGLMLAAQRDLPRWAIDQSNGVWAPEYTRSLADSRVLIVGYGHIGQAIEARLLPFETTVTKVASRAREDVHGISELDELLPTADIVVLVLPDTPQTRGLIGEKALKLMKDDALVVNVGRGTALQTDALLAEKGRIRAALDVTSPEPVPVGHPLWSAPGVFITPHIAGGSATVMPRARAFIDDQLRRWAAGEPLENRVQL